MSIRTSITSSMLVLLLTTSALADESMNMGKVIFYNTSTIKWGDAPPSLPKGAKAAVLYGDPTKSGSYVVRLKMPPGYKVPPHWHTLAENVTVISGSVYIGHGDTFDMRTAHELKVGGFHSIAPQEHHYAFSKHGAILQIHGDGPFNITYLNPADDPAVNAGSKMK